MFGGKTKRPQHSTFAKLAGAMGYTYALMRDNPPGYKNEIPKARAEYKAHKEALRKRRERAKVRK